METCVPGFGAHGHRGGSKVLHLLEFVAHTSCEFSKLLHVLIRASRVAADEIWDELLVQVGFSVHAVEQCFEVVEQLK